ncbi:hypothetical protein ACOCJ5_10355 [Knoellia sp. CPCC 206450]|uniref:hypothetical protein n=1 Tax=Knoellia tibetensis TaxID=3404798 RepID=UPI003B43C77A
MKRRRRTERLHAAMRDTHCPVCGHVIYRNHQCQGRPPAPLTPEQLRANVEACRAAMRTATEHTVEQGELF